MFWIGPKGDRGDKGDKGDQGEPGITVKTTETYKATQAESEPFSFVSEVGFPSNLLMRIWVMEE